MRHVMAILRFNRLVNFFHTSIVRCIWWQKQMSAYLYRWIIWWLKWLLDGSFWTIVNNERRDQTRYSTRIFSLLMSTHSKMSRTEVWRVPTLTFGYKVQHRDTPHGFLQKHNICPKMMWDIYETLRMFELRFVLIVNGWRIIFYWSKLGRHTLTCIDTRNSLGNNEE